jgi:carboxymethylenebutenolidase
MGKSMSDERTAVTESEVLIATPDGICDAHFVHPVGGSHAGVIVWPDGFGLRPAARKMGKRLALSGYSVLTVNKFYRAQPAPVFPEGASFNDVATRDKVVSLIAGLSPQTNMTDAAAFVDWLDAQPVVDKRRKIGTTGYCMGGAMAIRTAAARPDRIGACGSFHGGGIATGKPDSPHLLIPETQASFLFAIAQNDDATDPNAKETLRTACDSAGRPAEIEVYPAPHGWCAVDQPIYDQTQADKAAERLLALFEVALA